MKTVCLHNYHHNGFVVHIGCTKEPKSVQQALGKEHNLSVVMCHMQSTTYRLLKLYRSKIGII